MENDPSRTQGTRVHLAQSERGILIEAVRHRPTLAELVRNTPAEALAEGWENNSNVGSEIL